MDVALVILLDSSGAEPSIIMTSWHENALRITSPLWGESPLDSFSKGSVMYSFDVFCVVCLNTHLNNSPGAGDLWCHCDDIPSELDHGC